MERAHCGPEECLIHNNHAFNSQIGSFSVFCCSSLCAHGSFRVCFLVDNGTENHMLQSKFCYLFKSSNFCVDTLNVSFLSRFFSRNFLSKFIQPEFDGLILFLEAYLPFKKQNNQQIRTQTVVASFNQLLLFKNVNNYCYKNNFLRICEFENGILRTGMIYSSILR